MVATRQHELILVQIGIVMRVLVNKKLEHDVIVPSDNSLWLFLILKDNVPILKDNVLPAIGAGFAYCDNPLPDCSHNI